MLLPLSKLLRAEFLSSLSLDIALHSSPHGLILSHGKVMVMQA